MIYILAGNLGDDENECVRGFAPTLPEAVKLGETEVRENEYQWWYLADKYMVEIPLLKIPLFLFSKRNRRRGVGGYH